MKEIDELSFPEDRGYTDDHEWAMADGDLVVVGISDYAQDQLGDIVFVELPEIGQSFNQGEVFGTLESVKAVSEIYMPISGEVVGVNEGLEEAPELINTEPYTGGWIVKVKPGDAGQLARLKDITAYLEMLKG